MKTNTEPINKFNGSKLKELRVMKGLMLEELEVMLGCSASSISLWERGKRKPGVKNLRRIAEFFKIPISTFFLLCLMILPAHAAVDRDAAIRAIVGEAANQGPDGMTAVGEVIRHRGSVKGLYGFNAMNRRVELPSVWVEAQKAWDRSATSNLTHGATLFENIYKFGFPKSWDRSKVVCVAQIKDHWFFVEQ